MKCDGAEPNRSPHCDEKCEPLYNSSGSNRSPWEDFLLWRTECNQEWIRGGIGAIDSAAILVDADISKDAFDVLNSAVIFGEDCKNLLSCLDEYRWAYFQLSMEAHNFYIFVASKPIEERFTDLEGVMKNRGKRICKMVDSGVVEI